MKRFLIPLLAALTLPNSVNSDLLCGVKQVNCSKQLFAVQNDFDRALFLFKKGSISDSLDTIDSYIKKNNSSKKAYLLRAFIYDWGLNDKKNAFNDLKKALKIDPEYAEAHALIGTYYFWDFGNNILAKESHEKAIKIAPNNPHVNFEMAVRIEELAWILRDKNQNDDAIKNFQEAIKYYTLATLYQDEDPSFIMEEYFPLGIYQAHNILGDLNFELYFLYKNQRQRKIAKGFLEKAIAQYTKAIEVSPTNEIINQYIIDRDFDAVTLDQLHLSRGNAHSWDKNGSRKACKDWKVSKEFGNEEAKKNVREWRC